MARLSKVAGISLSASTMWVVGFFPIELGHLAPHRNTATLRRSWGFLESYWASRGDAATGVIKGVEGESIRTPFPSE